MPGRDQTGPLGMGSMTGRRFGICGGQQMPNYVNQGFGQGYGRGFGFGYRGGRQQFSGPKFRRRYVRPYYGFEPTVQDEKDYLKDETKYYEDALFHIKNRIHELDKSTDA